LGKLRFIGVKGVDEETWERFKYAVILRTGHSFGSLGEQVTRALGNYIAEAQNPGARAQIQIGSITIRRIRTILKRLPDQFLDSQLEEAITDVAGGEGRTVTRYRDLMIARGFVRLVDVKGTRSWYYEKREVPE
jgi:hypothetical protein